MTRSFLRACVGAGVALLVATTSVLGEYRWSNVKISGGGFVSGIVFSTTQKDLAYARTDVGGAYRWKASDRSWTPINDDLGIVDSQLTGVLSIALDPHDDQRVYLATGQYLPSWASNAAILSSTDQGAHWSHVTLPLKLGGNSDGRSNGERLQVDPNLGSILFLGTNQDGLWWSGNYAGSWTKVSSFPATSVMFVLFDPRSGSINSPSATIYVGVNSTTGPSLYQSTDGGATWNPVAGAPPGLLPHHAVIDPTGVLYLAYGDALGPNGVGMGAVWKLDTNNGNWTDITPPTGQGGFAGLSLDVQRPGTLIVTTMDRWYPKDEVYRSTDSGLTWKPLVASAIWDYTSAPWSNSLNPHWLGDVEIDPFNSNRALFITGFGIFGTENLTAADSGKSVTWSFTSEGIEETVPLALASPPSGPPLVSVIGDFDGFRHDYLNQSPINGRLKPSHGTSSSLDFAQLAPSIFVRTHNVGTRGAISTDGAATWSDFGSAPPAAVSNGSGSIVVSANGGTILWMPSRSGPYFSTDGGATWTPSATGPTSTTQSFVPVADRANSQRFFIYDGTAGALWVSNDGGVNFSPTPATLPTGAAAPVVGQTSPNGATTIWQPAWQKGLYRSSNSGVTFSKLPGVDQANRVGFGVAAPGRYYQAVYLVGRVGGVDGFFRSDDNGTTWIRINDDQHQYGWINAITGDPRVYGRVYLATGGRGIIFGEPSETPPLPPPPPPPPPPTVVLVYDDALVGSWQNWSWATVDMAATAPVHGGTKSVAVTISSSYSAFYLHSGISIDTSTHSNLVFWIHGGLMGGQLLQVAAHLSGTAQTTVSLPALTANTWQQISIPLSDLGVANKSDLDGWWIQDRSGGLQPVFYVDDMKID